jgi:type II secretory pathway predicted ATPase ExeA
MYEEVFQLESRPFVSAPYVKHYYATQSMSHTLTQTQLCIDRAAGPVIVIGGPGTGKSLLLTMLAEKYASRFNVVNLACARLAQRSDLLQNILFELQQPYRDMSEGELRLALIDFLKPSSRCPNGVLLLVDEAQVLDASLLDEVRLITNFVRDGQPRVRLIMAGTQELEEALTNPKLESFNQRIAARCYLSNLSYEETVGYVRTHIDRAGGRGEELIPDGTVRVLFEVTDGCPRLINQVCDQALMLAAVNNQSLLTEQCLQEAWRDVQNIPGAWARPKSDTTDGFIQQGTEGDQWTVLEFGQLEEEPTEGEVEGFEIATAEEQGQFAMENPVADDDADSGTNTFSEVDAGADSWDHLDEISAPLVEQMTEFTQRYGAAESLVTEDDIVDPLTAQIEEFQQRYGTSGTSEMGQTGEPTDDHDDLAIPLEAQVAELNMRSQLVESSIADEFLLLQHDSDDEFESPHPDSERNLENAAPLESITGNGDASDVATPPTSEDSESQSIKNPFDEEFQEEVLLLDQFLPNVAKQNRNSLRVTSGDLESIRTPQRHISLAELQADLLGENSIAPEAVADIDSQIRDNLPTVRQSQVTERQPEKTVPFESLESAGPGELETSSISGDESEGGQAKHRSYPGQPSNVDVMSPDFVERRKAEILLSLSDEEDIESAHSDGNAEKRGETLYERSYHEVLQAIEGRRNDAALGNLLPIASLAKVDADRLVDSESILEELKNQNRQLIEACSLGSLDENEVFDDEPSSLSIEYPVSQHEGYQSDEDTELPEDDRDMIIVSRADRLASPPQNAQHPDELMPRHASTGRAERMEYQKLFNQLRNSSTED